MTVNNTGRADPCGRPRPLLLPPSTTHEGRSLQRASRTPTRVPASPPRRPRPYAWARAAPTSLSSPIRLSNIIRDADNRVFLPVNLHSKVRSAGRWTAAA